MQVEESLDDRGLIEMDFNYHLIIIVAASVVLLCRRLLYYKVNKDK